MNLVSDIFRNKENIKNCLKSGNFRGTEIEDIFKSSLPLDDPEYYSWEWARTVIGKRYEIFPTSEIIPETILLKYIELVEFLINN